MAEGIVLDLAGLGALIEALRARGYRTIGPTVRDGAIVYDEVASIADLPVGWADEQDAATYRLERRDDDAVFGYAVGPHSWKRFLFPPAEVLWRARATGAGFEPELADPDDTAYAFIGVRACELSAIAVQDRVFAGDHPDPSYVARRARAFLVAVNCAEPAGTCFCASMGTGPRVPPGYDVAITELPGGGRFVTEAGSERGAELLGELPGAPASARDERAAEDVVTTAAGRMGRAMRTDGIRELLYASYEHPRWDDVASRCLACGNCTMVCPTCFCSTVTDATDLTGAVAERRRTWDSCFTLGFSELGGGHVRTTTRARYRQWMTHKLATWIDQFGTSGCVGCGRCITWCPVGIDLTAEARALREEG